MTAAPSLDVVMTPGTPALGPVKNGYGVITLSEPTWNMLRDLGPHMLKAATKG